MLDSNVIIYMLHITSSSLKIGVITYYKTGFYASKIYVHNHYISLHTHIIICK